MSIVATRKFGEVKSTAGGDDFAYSTIIYMSTNGSFCFRFYEVIPRVTPARHIARVVCERFVHSRLLTRNVHGISDNHREQLLITRRRLLEFSGMNERNETLLESFFYADINYDDLKGYPRAISHFYTQYYLSG